MQVSTAEQGKGVPEGFAALRNAGAFAEKNGPLYFRTADFALGFRVAPSHCNPVGVCHGGWLSAFLDMQMSATAIHEGGLDGRFLMTVSLSLDFLAAGPENAWIEGQATVLRRSNSLVFIQGLATSGGIPLSRASGVYKVISR
jgi:acyl-coenzyme A thioesterase PaaI-like protein